MSKIFTKQKNKILFLAVIFLFVGANVFAGIFGSIAEDYTGSSQGLDDRILGSKFYLSEKGLVQKVSAHLTINAGGDPINTSKAVVGIYNEAGNLVAQSIERSWDIPFQEPIQDTWFDFTFVENPTLTPGNYWLVAWSDTPSFVYISVAELTTLKTYRLDVVYSDNLPTSYTEAYQYKTENLGINATYAPYDVISFVPENISSLMAHLTTLMSDLGIVIWFAIGLPLGFWVIRKTISLFKKR